MDHRLRDAQVGGGEAAAEAAQTLLRVDPVDTVRQSESLPELLLLIQLQSGLDEPDRIGERTRGET